jgi:hypothetical protein
VFINKSLPAGGQGERSRPRLPLHLPKIETPGLLLPGSCNLLEGGGALLPGSLTCAEA